LEEAGIAFGKTHDLAKLLKQTKTVEPAWSSLDSELDYLNRFSTGYRYPGRSATKIVAKDAVSACRKARRVVRAAFGLPV
jgi:HEPN domain-containing protein